MTPRRFVTLAAALCGTVVLAGWVIAAVVGLGIQGIKNTDGGPTEDRRAPPLSVVAEPVDAPKATAMGKVGISNVDPGTGAASVTRAGASREAEAFEFALPDPSQMLPRKLAPVQIAAASTPAQRKVTVNTIGTASAVARTVKDKSFVLITIAMTINDEASRLRNDAIEWGQKLQELEADLKNNQNVDGTAKDVDEFRAVLRAAAERLAPDSETKATLRKQEDAIRDLAIRTEVHSNQATRKITGHFQEKTSELHAINRSFEEIRVRLVMEIDRLQQLKVQLEFNHAAAQNGKLLKDGEVIVEDIQALTADAQRLASDLGDFGGALPVARWARFQEPAMKKRGSYLALGVGLVAGTANAQGETQPIFIVEAPVTVPPSGVLMAQPPAPVAMPPSGVLMTQPFRRPDLIEQRSRPSIVPIDELIDPASSESSEATPADYAASSPSVVVPLTQNERRDLDRDAEPDQQARLSLPSPTLFPKR
jgi:hypothetical protein